MPVQKAMPQELPGIARNGMTAESLAISSVSVMRALTGNPASWEAADQYAWDACVTAAIREIDRLVERGSELSASVFAQAVREWYGGTETDWPNLPAKEKFVWEMIGRHLVNCVDSEPGAADVRSLEEQMARWARLKAKERGIIL